MRQRIVRPGVRDEIGMFGVVAGIDEGNATLRDARRYPSVESDAASAERALQGEIFVAGRGRIGAEEETRTPLGDPIGESIILAVECIEEDDARDSAAGAADVERIGSRQIAPAIGDEDTGIEAKRFAQLVVAILLGEMLRRLVQILAESTRLPEPPALESRASTANCGATRTALMPEDSICRGTPWRSRTSRSSVALLPWKNTTIHAGAARIETLGNIEQRAIIVVGRLLPQNAAARRLMAEFAILRHIEERHALVGMSP